MSATPARKPGMAISPSALGGMLEVFERNFRDRGELGASVCVWWNGVELVSSGHGWCEKEKQREWNEDTLAPVYSATKGPASAALLHALDTRGLDESTPVGEVWPKFPLPRATFAQMLSHQCGLAALDADVSVWDHDAVVFACENQRPRWIPGEGHGYHPRTFGFLLDDCTRRLVGMPLGEWWRREIADPLEIDVWIGLPNTEWPRVARLYPGRAEPSDHVDAFYEQFNSDGSLTKQAFGSPRGLHSVHEMNDPKAWGAGFPAMGGVASARGLAKFYQATIGALPSVLSESVRRALATPQSQADDMVLHRITAFTCGCQRDPLDAGGNKIRHLYGSSMRAFGHPGAGGCHAFADPETGVSFAYVMNQMVMSVMPGLKCQEMVAALFAES
ncbi:MAG: serine hydrolase domain-containing protein [Luteolibacter sp.]